MKKPRFFFLLVLPLVLSGCVSSSTSKGSWTSKGTYFTMDTTLFVELQDNSGKFTSDDVSAIFQKYNNLSDNTQSYSGLVNVYNLNASNSALSVSEELYDLLSYAEGLRATTNGYFNPLIGGLSDLWKSDLFGSSDALGASVASTFVPSIPSDSEIQAELSKMNSSSLLFDKTALTVQRVGEAKIDLGGIAKGYAAEKAKEALSQAGVTRYLVNAGSSTLLFGENITEAGTFSMGLSDLGSGVYATLKNCVVGTSAITEQKQTVNGQLYSHIVNPLTGSALVDWYGTTIVGQDAALLDGLSTSFVLLGPDGAKSYLSTYSLSALFYKNGISTLVDEGITLYGV
jgi:thiamine biosynthesis lipoprotein